MNEKKIELYLKNSDFMFGVFDNAYLKDPERSKKGTILEGVEIEGKVYGMYQGRIYDTIQTLLCGKYHKEGQEIFPYSKDKKTSYDKATEQLLQKIKIRGILIDIILPYQRSILKQHEIEFLRRSWNNGNCPNEVKMKNYDENADKKLDRSSFYQTNFLEYYISKDKGFDFVKGWTKWAFVYFGELDEEPEMRIGNSSSSSS